MTVTGALPDSTSTEKEALGGTGVVVVGIGVGPPGVAVAVAAVIETGPAVLTIVASGPVAGDDSCPAQAVNTSIKVMRTPKTVWNFII